MGRTGTLAAQGWSGWTHSPFWVTASRTQCLEQAAAVGSHIFLHLFSLAVSVLQEGLKIGGTHKFVLHVSQDRHVPRPTVSKADRHQLLQGMRQG